MSLSRSPGLRAGLFVSKDHSSDSGFLVAKPTAEQERAIISALKSLGWSLGLDGMSIRTVRATCPSLTSDEAAREVIRELFERGLIAQEMESGGTLDVRKNIPMAKCRWISK